MDYFFRHDFSISWITAMARATSTFCMATHVPVSIVSKVVAIERHADVITSKLRNDNATTYGIIP